LPKMAQKQFTKHYNINIINSANKNSGVFILHLLL